MAVLIKIVAALSLGVACAIIMGAIAVTLKVDPVWPFPAVGFVAGFVGSIVRRDE